MANRRLLKLLFNSKQSPLSSGVASFASSWMNLAMAFPTNRDQILFRIMTEVTPQRHVMNLKVGTW
jgi:hypothetical protein